MKSVEGGGGVKRVLWRRWCERELRGGGWRERELREEVGVKECWRRRLV